VIPRLTYHSYGDLTVDFESTCVVHGQSSKKCIWCGLKDGDSITELPLAEHTYSEHYTIDTQPTCTATGTKSRHCTVAGCTASTDPQSVDKVPHTYEETNRVSATCLTNGTITYTCSVCGDSYDDTETLTSLGHAYDSVITQPTCTEDGYTTHTCSRCGDTYTDSETDALGHTCSEADVQNVVNPTCSSLGSYDLVCICDRCGHEMSRETVEVPKLAHTPLAATTENVIEPTCTEDGSHDDVVYCAVCNEELSRTPVTDEALGHDYVPEVTEPTCTEGGYTTYTCSRCGDEYVDDETEALGHDPSDWTVKVASTCTEKGTEVIICNRCNDELDTREMELDPDNHTFEVNTTNEVDPTCTEKGKRIDTCSGCGITKEVELDALGHKYVSKVTKEPTYDEDGVKTYTCTRCSNSYTEAIPKLDRPADTDDDSSSDVVVEETPTPTPEPAPSNPAPTRPGTSAQTEVETEAEILAELDSKTDDKVVIETSDAKLSAEVLKKAAETNNDIVLKTENYTWYIKASDIEEAKDVDLTVTVGTSDIDVEELKNFVKDSQFVEVTLSYDGPFGFNAVLEINVDKVYNNQLATLFYYNNGEFEEMDKVVVSNGLAEFNFSHASEYVVVFDEENVEKEAPERPATNTKDTKVEKTEDTKAPVVTTVAEPVAVVEEEKKAPVLPIVLGSSLVALIAVAVVLFKRKK